MHDMLQKSYPFKNIKRQTNPYKNEGAAIKIFALILIREKFRISYNIKFTFASHFQLLLSSSIYDFSGI